MYAIPLTKLILVKLEAAKSIKMHHFNLFKWSNFISYTQLHVQNGSHMSVLCIIVTCTRFFHKLGGNELSQIYSFLA